MLQHGHDSLTVFGVGTELGNQPPGGSPGTTPSRVTTGSPSAAPPGASDPSTGALKTPPWCLPTGSWRPWRLPAAS
ncbi:hypothetical protein [Nonomuraea wenchangensis]|uniref:hypothetical protein n=1 Tax=Nonomuraea wenchangensis TaxID=568860 RepID=UPI003332169D